MSGKLYLGAPPGQRWPLDLDTVIARLRDRFPGALVERRTSAITGSELLSFDVYLADGQQRHGTYVDGGKLTLSDGAPTDWADTLAWFISLLPRGTPMIAMVEDDPAPTAVPDGVQTPAAISAFLESLATP